MRVYIYIYAYHTCIQFLERVKIRGGGRETGWLGVVRWEREPRGKGTGGGRSGCRREGRGGGGATAPGKRQKAAFAFVFAFSAFASRFQCLPGLLSLLVRFQFVFSHFCCRFRFDFDLASCRCQRRSPHVVPPKRPGGRSLRWVYARLFLNCLARPMVKPI